jgi:hypothetical protein
MCKSRLAIDRSAAGFMESGKPFGRNPFSHKLPFNLITIISNFDNFFIKSLIQ